MHHKDLQKITDILAGLEKNQERNLRENTVKSDAVTQGKRTFHYFQEKNGKNNILDRLSEGSVRFDKQTFARPKREASFSINYGPNKSAKLNVSLDITLQGVGLYQLAEDKMPKGSARVQLSRSGSMFQEKSQGWGGQNLHKVVGGVMAKIGEAPWQVLIKSSKDEDFACGGAILNLLYVVTTATCARKLRMIDRRLRSMQGKDSFEYVA